MKRFKILKLRRIKAIEKTCVEGHLARKEHTGISREYICFMVGNAYTWRWRIWKIQKCKILASSLHKMGEKVNKWNPPLFCYFESYTHFSHSCDCVVFFVSSHLIMCNFLLKLFSNFALHWKAEVKRGSTLLKVLRMKSVGELSVLQTTQKLYYLWFIYFILLSFYTVFTFFFLDFWTLNFVVIYRRQLLYCCPPRAAPLILRVT